MASRTGSSIERPGQPSSSFARWWILPCGSRSPRATCLRSWIFSRLRAGNLYPDHYIAAAAKAGIVSGLPGRGGKLYFRPENSITLAQMVTMSTRAAGRGLYVPPSDYRSAWGNFDPEQGVIARVAQYNGLLRDFPLKTMSPWRAAHACGGSGDALQPDGHRPGRVERSLPR